MGGVLGMLVDEAVIGETASYIRMSVANKCTAHYGTKLTLRQTSAVR